MEQSNVNPNGETTRCAANSHNGTLLSPIYKIDEFSQRFATIRDSSAYRESKLLQLTAATGAEIGIPTSV